MGARCPGWYTVPPTSHPANIMPSGGFREHSGNVIYPLLSVTMSTGVRMPLPPLAWKVARAVRHSGFRVMFWVTVMVYRGHSRVVVSPISTFQCSNFFPAGGVKPHSGRV